MIRTDPAANEVVEFPRRSNGISWWWVAPCLLALAAFAFVLKPLSRFGGLAPERSVDSLERRLPSQLGFSASHEGSDWRLVWNRDALARLNAVGAMLTIRDGGNDRLQFLSAQDLAAGSIFYVPRTSDLTFNLKVVPAGGPDVEEQIRVLGSAPDNAPQLAESVPPRRIGDAARESAAVTSGAEPRNAPRQFQPPARKSSPPAPVAEISLPEARLPAAPAVRLPQQAAVAPPPPRPMPELPKPDPPSPQQIATPPRSAPAPIIRTEPAPLHTIAASWPRNTARTAPMEVRIRVRIDPQGRVINATPMQRNVANFPFVDSALSAARLWTFTPASESGKPVPSETILTFKFTP